MPRKAWTQKNRHQHGSNLPEGTWLAIRKQFCKGKLQGQAATVISRWARQRGLKSVSRATVNKHYAEIGDVLWYLAYVDIHDGEEPTRETTYFDALAARPFVYADRAKDNEVKAAFKSPGPLLRMISERKLFNSLLIDELEKDSKRMNGISEKTFHIRWARAYWIEQIAEQYPEDTMSAVRMHLFSKLLNEGHQYKPRAQRPIRHAKNIGYRYEHYRLGTVYVRITYNEYDDPCMAERYAPTKREWSVNNRLLEEIFLGDPDDLMKISQKEFERATRC